MKIFSFLPFLMFYLFNSSNAQQSKGLLRFSAIIGMSKEDNFIKNVRQGLAYGLYLHALLTKQNFLVTYLSHDRYYLFRNAHDTCPPYLAPTHTAALDYATQSKTSISSANDCKICNHKRWESTVSIGLSLLCYQIYSLSIIYEGLSNAAAYQVQKRRVTHGYMRYGLRARVHYLFANQRTVEMAYPTFIPVL